MKMLEDLNSKERSAIELRYLGNTSIEISEKIEIPKDTVEGWFKAHGKLYTAYQEYVTYMNQKRQEETEKKINVADEEWFVLTTNIVRQIGKKIQNQDDPDKFYTRDLERIWKIQRLMQGLPISYEKQDVEQTNMETDKIIQELGLTDEDFNDENIEATTRRITDYLRGE